MAGSGVALRLHEFKERRGTGQYDRSTERKPIVPRHGRDVHGLYPGQLGRVHTDYSPLYRKGPSSPLDPLRLETSTEDHLYQRSFDLLTLEALEHSHRSGQTAARPQPRTTYQEDFGLQSHFYPPDDTKFTLLSHPGPLQPRTLCLPRGIFEE